MTTRVTGQIFTRFRNFAPKLHTISKITNNNTRAFNKHSNDLIRFVFFLTHVVYKYLEKDSN